MDRKSGHAAEEIRANDENMATAGHLAIRCVQYV